MGSSGFVGRYYYPELDLDGTADELFIQARNGYIENPAALAKIQEILLSSVEWKLEKALYVGVLKEIAEDDGSKPYVFAQIKKDILDGVKPEEVTVRDGLTLEVSLEQDEVLAVLRDDEVGSLGASSVTVDQFLEMSADEFEACVNSVYYYQLLNDEQKASIEDEPLVDISDLEYDDEGYLRFRVEADGYSLEGLYRLYDPANGPDMSLVSIDYGDRHPIIQRQWDRIEMALYDVSWKQYHEILDKSEAFKEKIIAAMEAAGYTYDVLESHEGWHRFYGEGGSSMGFDRITEAAEWLDGVVFDDPEVSRAVEEIMHPERYEPEPLQDILEGAQERSCASLEPGVRKEDLGKDSANNEVIR